MLHWIICAIRPLSVDELGIALAIKPGQRSFDSALQLRNLKNLLPQLCRSLIEIDPQTRVVRLVHASVKDFLLRTANTDVSSHSSLVDTSAVNALIARVCFTFLCFSRKFIKVDTDRESSLLHFSEYILKYPFLEHSTLYWVQHMACILEVPAAEAGELPVLFAASESVVLRWLQVIKTLDAAGPWSGLALTKDLMDELVASDQSRPRQVPGYFTQAQ